MELVRASVALAAKAKPDDWEAQRCLKYQGHNSQRPSLAMNAGTSVAGGISQPGPRSPRIWP
jgi:hypothetical protein